MSRPVPDRALGPSAPAPHGATAWVDEHVQAGRPAGQRVERDEAPRELTVTIRRAAAPDPLLDVLVGAWAWLEVVLVVVAARGMLVAAGGPSAARGVGPWTVGATLGALTVASVVGALLVWARVRRVEREVARTDSHTLWLERHTRFGATTRAFEVERIADFRIVPPRPPGVARLRRRWWPEARLAFEIDGRTTRLGRGLDDSEAAQLLDALAPWLESDEDGPRRVVPHGAAILAALPPEIGAGGARCGRCGAERVSATAGVEGLDASSAGSIAWCDGCAAWVETLHEPSAREADRASRWLTLETVEGVPALALSTRPTWAVRARGGAATLGSGAAILALVSGLALAAPTIPEPMVRDAVLLLGAAAAATTLGSALAWLVVRQPPHRILLLPEGMRIAWRRGPWQRSLELAYQRTTSLGIHRGDRPSVRARMGAVTVVVAGGLDVREARELAQGLRYHAAHAAWRAGRTPGWVPRMELVCRRCGASIDPPRDASGAAPDPVQCGSCQRAWPLAEALAPSLARIALEPELSDDLDVSASPLRGTIVRVGGPPAWRRLGAFVPAVALAGGGWVAFRLLPGLGLANLRPWSMVAVATGVLLALRALTIATVRAHEIGVGHETLTLRRVRLVGSTSRRVPIERVAAVLRPVRGRRAAEDEPRRAAVRLLVRRSIPVPGLGPEVVRLGAHLPAHDQLWLARTLDRLIFETAYPPDAEPHGADTNERMHST